MSIFFNSLAVKMTSFKQLIVSAIYKISEENPALNVEGQMSAEEARNDFIRKLIAELFPECPDITLPASSMSVTIPIIKAEEKKKRGRKPKAVTTGNIEKLNPTQTKKLKQIAQEMKVEGDKQVLLDYLNGVTAEEFEAKKFEDHVRDCFAPKNDSEPEKIQMNLVIVEFEGKDYYVNEESKRVYVPKGEPDDDGMYTGWEPVGYVGMAAFKEMTLDE